MRIDPRFQLLDHMLNALPPDHILEESSPSNLKQRGCYRDLLNKSLKWTDDRLSYLTRFLDIIANHHPHLKIQLASGHEINFEKELVELGSADYDSGRMY